MKNKINHKNNTSKAEFFPNSQNYIVSGLVSGDLDFFYISLTEKVSNYLVKPLQRKKITDHPIINLYFNKYTDNNLLLALCSLEINLLSIDNNLTEVNSIYNIKLQKDENFEFTDCKWSNYNLNVFACSYSNGNIQMYLTILNILIFKV